ncbi:MAG: ThuA domain-containing protein [Pirellulales bacterium]|nr:ThuA domain-containing protein [Pirellulales bacterium]
MFLSLLPTELVFMRQLHDFFRNVGWAALCAVGFAIFASGSAPAAESAASASAKSGDKGARILFLTYSGGFKHGSVTRKDDKLSPSELAMTELGIKSGLFRVDCTQDPAEITKEKLDQYDIVMFYTTGPRDKFPIKEEDMEYFLGTWLKQKGHGFIGTHSAADTMADYEPYWDMIGGSFAGHPWNAGDTVTVSVHEPEHPICKPWGGTEFEIQDEIYQFRNWQPEKVRVLMSLDMAKTKLKKPYHVPIAWCKEYGEGKALHMSLGHNESVWANPKYQESLLGGIKWILGKESGNAEPNPELSKEQGEKAKAAVVAAGGNPDEKP